MKKRTVVTFDPNAEHKMLSNYCFAELINGEQGQHEKCPADFICDCPHHEGRVFGVEVDCKTCRDTGRVFDYERNVLTDVKCDHDATQLPLQGVA